MTNISDTSTEGFGSFGAFLEHYQREAGVTDDQVAEAMGLTSAKFYALVKKGQARFPLARVPRLAEVLQLDEGWLCEAFLRFHAQGELADLLKRVTGMRGLSESEKKVVLALRHITKGNPDVEPRILDGSNIVLVVTT